MAAGLRIAFAGTPDPAAVILARLIEAGRHTVHQVITQPDRQSGRGRKRTAGPVKALAQRHGIPVAQPASSKQLPDLPALRESDLLIVAAYGMILPERAINLPRYGSVNVHMSLLPRWRGAAPIQRAIEAGDRETGITLMQMDAGLDTGDILLQESCPIQADDTAGSLQERLAGLGAECLIRALERLPAGELVPQPQDATRATYAAKVTKAEAEIEWSLPAPAIERKIRAFNPSPVAHTVLNRQPMRIWQARALNLENTAPPGSILQHAPEGLDVATGEGVLRILVLQLPGKKALGCREFYNGHPHFNA